MEIGSSFRILTPDAPASTDGRIDLRLTRGAFGSGEHETTASCLEVLETLEVSGGSVLDLGSGTAVLAIAALELGAEYAVCIDISPKAIQTGQRNCKLNDVSDRVEHIAGTIGAAPAGPFNLVLANIYGDILLEVAPALVARAAPAAPILLSGILWQDSFDVETAYARLGCQRIATRMLQEYATILLTGPTEVPGVS